MQTSARYPSHEEIEIIMARARRMRSIYVGAQLSSTLRRVQRFFADEGGRRYPAVQRNYPDTA